MEGTAITPDGQKLLALLEHISGQLAGVLNVTVTLEGAKKAMREAAEALGLASKDFAMAATANNAAATALAAASKELHQSASADYQLTITRGPRP